MGGRLDVHSGSKRRDDASVRRTGIGNKNIAFAEEWLADDFIEHQVFPGTTPDKKGAIDSYRIFFEASPDMRAQIEDAGPQPGGASETGERPDKPWVRAHSAISVRSNWTRTSRTGADRGATLSDAGESPVRP